MSIRLCYGFLGVEFNRLPCLASRVLSLFVLIADSLAAAVDVSPLSNNSSFGYG